jgi:hypothetical protein
MKLNPIELIMSLVGKVEPVKDAPKPKPKKRAKRKPSKAGKK